MHIYRTYEASIVNDQQVSDDLDRCGFSASKLWNVGLYYCNTQWDETREIPDEKELKSELKTHDKYKDLHSQSSQRVLEECAEAFSSWYGSEDNRDNPPGYRKENYYDNHGNCVHEEHPRSTVTWKQNGIIHDTEGNGIRLSKGKNQKEHRSDFIWCHYETRPDVTVEGIQQVRAVYTGDEWRLHIVCQHEIETPDSPGEEVAGVDLGICNFAAVAFSTDSSVLYPGNYLKENEYYLTKEIANCDSSFSNRATRLHHKRSERRTHFFHALAKHLVGVCCEENVGRLIVGDVSGIRDEADGSSVDWGPHGNLDLHGWAFDRFVKILTYKAKERGIVVEPVDEHNTSKTCCQCGRKDNSQRVERGLYVCEECGFVGNADCNGAENIRYESNSESLYAGDRSTGCLAQPSVYLHSQTHGFIPGATAVDC